MKIEREHSFNEALASGINLFLGSAFSLLARDAENNLLPAGEPLAKDLRSAFEVDPTGTQDLSRLATIIAASRRAELRDYLTRRFSVETFDPRYKSIANIRISTIFSTNIDDLPFKIYEDNPARYLNDLDRNGPMIRDRAAVDYVALHGSVRNPDRPYRFGAAEIAASFGVDPDRWRLQTPERLRHSMSTAIWQTGDRTCGSFFRRTQKRVRRSTSKPWASLSSLQIRVKCSSSQPT
jgi:hypothetical protein